MNNEYFNQCLGQLSQIYFESQLLKFQLKKIDISDILLSLSNHQMNNETLKKISRISKQQINYKNQSQGSLQKSLILQWVNKSLPTLNNSVQLSKKPIKTSQNKKFTLDDINKMFPFNKISYTTLITRCLDGLFLTEDEFSYRQVQVRPTLQLIKVALTLQMLSIEIKSAIISSIPLYIPISEKNLTIQQLKDYFLCQNVQANAQYVILALNGTKSQGNVLQYEFGKSDKQSQNIKPQKASFSSIEAIMNRLQSRVQNFGKQWLLDQHQSN